MAEPIQISFITPVFNEALNITRFLKNLYNILSQYPHWNYEVILIEDGSQDDTKRLLFETVKQYANTRVIYHKKNLGFNRSLQDGIAEAKGRFLMYVGADEEFDSSEIPDFITPLLEGKADVVLGVRWQRNAYRLSRFFLSVIYIFLLNYLFKLRVNDYNWSQAWSREFLDRIDMRSKSLFILPEIVIRAFDLNYRVLETPSNHRGRQYGKSSLNFRIMAYALWDALEFNRHRKSKHYRAAARPPVVRTEDPELVSRR